MNLQPGKYKTRDEIPEFKIEVIKDAVYLSFLFEVIDRRSPYIGAAEFSVFLKNNPEHPLSIKTKAAKDTRTKEEINKGKELKKKIFETPFDGIYRTEKVEQKEVKRLLKRFYNKSILPKEVWAK